MKVLFYPQKPAYLPLGVMHLVIRDAVRENAFILDTGRVNICCARWCGKTRENSTDQLYPWDDNVPRSARSLTSSHWSIGRPGTMGNRQCQGLEWIKRDADELVEGLTCPGDFVMG